MRKLLAGLLLIGTVGCGTKAPPTPTHATEAEAAEENPANDVMPPGTAAVVVGTSVAIVRKPSPGREGLVYLEPGTRVTVGDDPHVYRELDVEVESRALEREEGWPEEAEAIRKAGPRTFPLTHPSSSHRLVRIVAENGEHRGVAGGVSRYHLRPVGRQ